MPTLAFTLARRAPSEVASALAAHGARIAAGLMCAPRAHDALGTGPDGVVRVSVGPAATDEDVGVAAEAVARP